MARAVALLGEGASPALAAELAELDLLTAEEALEALCRADVLTRDGDGLGFVHPIVLSAIYNDLPVRARSEGHGRAARLLHAHGAAPEEVASQLALTAPAATRGSSRRCAPRPRGRCRSATPSPPRRTCRARWPSRRRPRGDPRRPRAGRVAVRRARRRSSTSARRCGWRPRPSAVTSRSGSRAA